MIGAPRDPDDDPPTEWVQRLDGKVAPVYDGWVDDDEELDVAALDSSDCPIALAAAVLYLDPLDALDHDSADEGPVESRSRDVYDVILEHVWDTAVASVWADDPHEIRRAELAQAYWMLFSAMPGGRRRT